MRQVLEKVAVNISTTTISTAFSGIHAPGTALEIIRQATGSILGVNIPAARHTWAIEWYAESRTELSIHRHEPCCCFGNTSAFYEF